MTGGLIFAAAAIGLRLALNAAPHPPASFAVIAVAGSIGLAVLAALLLPRSRMLPIAVMLATVFLVVPSGPIGDTSWPAIIAEGGPIWLSSPGGHVLVAAFLASPVGLIGYQLMGLLIVGIAAYVLVVRIPWLGGEGIAAATSRVAVAVAVAAFPIAALYRSVHWETTAFAPAIGMLGVAVILAGVTSWGRRALVESLMGLAVTGVAVGIHPAAIVLVPAVLVLAIPHLWTLGPWRRLTAVGVAGASIAVGVAAVLLASLATGRGFTPGDAQGGGDGSMLAPDLFGVAHWKMWALAIAVSGGAGLCVAIAGAWQAIRPDQSVHRRAMPALLPAAVIALTVSALGTWLWGFDLGFPVDADLMAVFGSGIPVAGVLAVLVLASRRFGSWAALAASSVAAMMGVWLAFALAPLPI